MPYIDLDNALLDIGKRVDEFRQSLYYLDTAVLSRQARVSDLGRQMRAMTYVGGSAALERFVTASLDAVMSEMAAAACPLNHLRLSLFAIVCEPELLSLRSRRHLDHWDERSDLFELVSDNTKLFPYTLVKPLDGKTLRGRHFRWIWRVFGFPGPPLPAGRHQGVLEDLAVNRNDVAHGDVDPLSVGRRKTVEDVLSMLSRVEEIAIHLHTTAERYLDVQGYLR